VFSLKDMTAFVTGGTSGIGLATANRFARAGAKVVIVGRRASGHALAEEFDGLFIQADIAEEDQLVHALEAAEKSVGKLDIIMNNAGIAGSGETIEEADADKFQRLIDINIKAVYNGLRHGPRHMSNGGSIINISSIAVDVQAVRNSQYAATKAAVISLTKSAAAELVVRNIRVNAICPGWIWSELVPTGGIGEELAKRMSPMGRVGEPEELAAACHFLASPDASYITGQILTVDGGLVACLADSTRNAILSGDVAPRSGS
jgi:NAD(P)-dependent dehydrogenase (short-subunit alcohol dehydrogenase family)